MAQNETVEASSFFKVILQRTLEDKKLVIYTTLELFYLLSLLLFKMIPEKFVKNFGDELCDVATLKVPNGRVWHMGLTKESRKIWFNDGWHDFVKYHSICVGHFLIFKYAKNSTFDVFIIDDTTACEIDYPNNPEEPKSEDMESEVKTLSSLKRKVLSNKSEMERLEEMDESRQRKVNMSTRHEEEHEFEASLEKMGIYICRAPNFLSAEEKQRVIHAVELFKPVNPSFVRILSSKTRYSNYLYLSSKFACKYLKKVDQSITIRDLEGREWHVKLRWSSWWCRMQGVEGGWSAFWKDKDLKGGDVCLFELIRTEGVVLLVSVLSGTSYKSKLSA